MKKKRDLILLRNSQIQVLLRRKMTHLSLILLDILQQMKMVGSQRQTRQILIKVVVEEVVEEVEVE